MNVTPNRVVTDTGVILELTIYWDFIIFGKNTGIGHGIYLGILNNFLIVIKIARVIRKNLLLFSKFRKCLL